MNKNQVEPGEEEESSSPSCTYLQRETTTCEKTRQRGEDGELKQVGCLRISTWCAWSRLWSWTEALPNFRAQAPYSNPGFDFRE